MSTEVSTEAPMPWYLGYGPEARAERVRRGLETENGAVVALTQWEADREPGGPLYVPVKEDS